MIKQSLKTIHTDKQWNQRLFLEVPFPKDQIVTQLSEKTLKYFFRIKKNFFLSFGSTARHAGSSLPDQGSNLHPLQRKRTVLTTGLPRKSREDYKILLILTWLLKKNKPNQTNKKPQKQKTCSEKQSEAFSSHLPHGFNSFFEEMEVTVACQVPGTYHVAVKPPELLHLQREDSRVKRCFLCFFE